MERVDKLPNITSKENNITEDIESMEHEGSLFFEKKEKKIQKTKKSSWNLKIR